MKKSDIGTMPEFFDRYINLTEDKNLNETLADSLADLQNKDFNRRLELLGERVYAPGKWRIRDIFQHIIDAERIFTNRALRFMRGDQTALPGFNENEYATAASQIADLRTLAELSEELQLLRWSNILMFRNLPAKNLAMTGRASGVEISVGALGFTMAGHQKHHLKVIEERYFPLLEK